MTLVETIISVVVIVLGVALYGSWLIFDRKLSWTFFLAAFLYPPMFFFFFYVRGDWIGFSVASFMFIVLVHLYIYDKYFTHYGANKRGRR